MSLSHSLTFILTLLFCSSCASIFSKSTYDVAINSQPSSAALIITDSKGNEVFNGQTPATVPLKSGAGFFSRASYTVTLNQNGYDTKTYILEGKIDGWYFGNLLIGGLIGIIIVDPYTGAMWKLDDSISVSLDQQTSQIKIGDPNNQQRLSVLTLEQLPKEYHQHLTAIK